MSAMFMFARQMFRVTSFIEYQNIKGLYLHNKCRLVRDLCTSADTQGHMGGPELKK